MLISVDGTVKVKTTGQTSSLPMPGEPSLTCSLPLKQKQKQLPFLGLAGCKGPIVSHGAVIVPTYTHRPNKRRAVENACPSQLKMRALGELRHR